MKLVKVKLNELIFPERNVRIHTKKQIDEFVRSLKMFGQIRPVVVDENNTILCGNGLVEAMKKAGYTEADAYKICDLTENQKKKLMIADNKIFSLGIENLDTLNHFIEDLSDDLDIPGFDEDILNSMIETAVETTERIAEYGILNENDINEIKSNENKKEVAIEKAISENDTKTDETTESKDETSADESIISNNFIVCPKCGEKIWL